MKINELLKINVGDDNLIFNVKHRAIKNYKLMQWAKVATFGLYIVAVFMLYVSDVWGIASFIAQKSNDWVALIVFSVIAFVLAYFLASSKEMVYEDIAIQRSEGYKLKPSQIIAIGLFMSSGLLFEAFSTSNNQQHIANAATENSAMFKSVTESNVALSTGGAALTQDLQKAQMRLADCNVKLEKAIAAGRKFDCAQSEANLAAVREAINAANALAQSTNAQALEAKTDAMLKVREHFDKPMFQTIGKATGTDNNTGMMLVIGVLIFIFECQHVMAMFAYANALRRLKQSPNADASIQTVPANLTQPTYSTAPLSAPVSAFAPLADSARQTVGEFAASVEHGIAASPAVIADELGKAQAGREAANRATAEKLGQVGQAIDNLTRPNLTAPTQPDRVEPVSPQPDLTAPAQPDRANRDLTDRTRYVQMKRPTLDYKTAVGMISAQVRGQIESGKVRKELRQVKISCELTYDQLSFIYPLPELDLALVAKSILDNLTVNMPEPDLAWPDNNLTRPTAPNNLTGQVGQVSLEAGQVSPQPDLEMSKKLADTEAKLAEMEAEKVRLAAQAEADRKAAEAEKVRLQAAAAKLAEAKAREAVAKARAEAQAKAQAEAAAREAAAAQAADDAQSRAAAQAESDERGKLTQAQIDLAAQVIADAIKAGQVQTLGFGNLSPLIKAAGLPKSSDTVRLLIKLACRKLTASGITAPNPNEGNGKPDFVIA